MKKIITYTLIILFLCTFVNAYLYEGLSLCVKYHVKDNSIVGINSTWILESDPSIIIEEESGLFQLWLIGEEDTKPKVLFMTPLRDTAPLEIMKALDPADFDKNGNRIRQSNYTQEEPLSDYYETVCVPYYTDAKELQIVKKADSESYTVILSYNLSDYYRPGTNSEGKKTYRKSSDSSNITIPIIIIGIVILIIGTILFSIRLIKRKPKNHKKS